jgi:hypothetical protein
MKAVEKFNPKAFYSIEDIKAVSEGVFPERTRSFRKLLGGQKGKA